MLKLLALLICLVGVDVAFNGSGVLRGIDASMTRAGQSAESFSTETSGSNG